MSKPVKILAMSVLSLSLLPFTAPADESAEGEPSERQREMTREERRAAWESLSEEEKQAKREEMRVTREQRRAEWQAMTPEEREAKRAEMRKRMESMTPEQREAVRKRSQQRRHHAGKRGETEQSE